MRAFALIDKARRTMRLQIIATRKEDAERRRDSETWISLENVFNPRPAMGKADLWPLSLAFGHPSIVVSSPIHAPASGNIFPFFDEIMLFSYVMGDIVQLTLLSFIVVY